MRGMADFEPDYASNYFVPCETVKPQLDRLRAAHLDQLSAREVVESNLAAGGFLELLDKFRDVFLQDSVFIRRSHPYYLIFRDALFATAEYAAFATAVEAATDTLRPEDLYLVAIEKGILSINERLQSMKNVIQTGQASHAVALAWVTGAVNELAGKLDDFLTGSFSLTSRQERAGSSPKATTQQANPAGTRHPLRST
jgi:hypothetical protein